MSMSARSTRWLIPSVALCAAVGVALPGVATAHTATPKVPKGPSYTVIASGLNNPRGLALGDHDTLYVAEAGLGAGGFGGAVEGDGQTGSITRITKADSRSPQQSRVVTGIWSTAEDHGGGLESVGIDGLAIADHGKGALYGIMAEHAEDSSTNFGYLVKVKGKHLQNRADVGGAGYAWTTAHQNDAWAPAGQFPDANPYGLLMSQGHTYVVDAGANTLDEVLPDGTVTIVAYFPNTALSDSVPTCVAQGPDGALYIGNLSLAEYFQSGAGQSTVYRVDPAATDPSSINTVLNVATVWATGFSTITGCAFDRMGNFYAAEMFENDVQIAPFNDPTNVAKRSFLTDPLVAAPNGIAVADDGHEVYVSVNTNSESAGQGQVVRIKR